MFFFLLFLLLPAFYTKAQENLGTVNAVGTSPLPGILIDKKDSIKDDLTLATFKNNYHMILRDLESETISKFLADWIHNLHSSNSIEESINILKNSKYYHITEK